MKSLAEALRDWLVCGLLSENIQKVLLTKADLTLEKALETAQGMEAAAQKSKELKGSHRSDAVPGFMTGVIVHFLRVIFSPLEPVV